MMMADAGHDNVLSQRVTAALDAEIRPEVAAFAQMLAVEAGGGEIAPALGGGGVVGLGAVLALAVLGFPVRLAV